MIKVSFFSGENELGPTVVPLFNTKTDAYLEKVASSSLLPDVVKYIEALKPRNDTCYTLVNAMGAGEFFGSNINGDYFTEASLIHRPDIWTGNPLVDKVRSKDWAYGFPTFYYAYPYAHHRNKDSKRAFGEVELAVWHDQMKRVELVTRIDKEKCLQFGGIQVWDKLKAGQFPDVSMGCFTAGARVTLADGSRKPIEQIEVGDRVLTHRGRSQRVSALHKRQYSGDLYSIKAEAAPQIHCTKQHPFLVVEEDQVKESVSKRDMQWKQGLALQPWWVHAECLDLDSYALAPVPSETNEDIAASRTFARLLGYYLAEGHLLRNKAGGLCGVELTTHQDDAVHQEIDQLCADFGTKNPPAFAPRANSACAVAVYIHDEHLARMCLQYAGVYSKEKKLDEAVLLWEPKLQLELVGAYANGDGCGPDDGSLKWSTSSESLAWQLQLILARSGLLASVNCLHHKASDLVKKDTDEWVVHLGKQFAQRLRAFTAKVKPVEILKAKNSRMVGQDKVTADRFVVTPLRSIEAIYAEVDVFNIEVEEDESYIVEGLAVHNCKVPFDTCSICLDWQLYREAQSTYKPGQHKSPGEAVLQFHRTRQKIRGVSITRADYCEHAKKQMNRILPDGRKVFVYNDYPKFFDISFVFIGADKTAKVMMKLAGSGSIYGGLSVDVAEKLGYVEEGIKIASLDYLKTAFLGKNAKDKDAEITKDVIPSQFAGQAVPALTASEPDIPEDILDALGTGSLKGGLSTSAGMGVVMRPREFQRVVLLNLGRRDLADEYHRKNVVFPKSNDTLSMDMGPESFSHDIARLLLPLLLARSALAPAIEKRVLMIRGTIEFPDKCASSASHSSELMRKIGSAYNGYRQSIMDLVAHAQPLLGTISSHSGMELRKLSSASVDQIFSPLSVSYINSAFWDELGVEKVSGMLLGNQTANGGVERGYPSKNTR